MGHITSGVILIYRRNPSAALSICRSTGIVLEPVWGFIFGGEGRVGGRDSHCRMYFGRKVGSDQTD